MTTQTVEIVDSTQTARTGRARGLTPFKPGQSGNPSGKRKGPNKAARAMQYIYERIESRSGGVKRFIDDLIESDPALVFQMWCKLQPKEIHSTHESKRLVMVINQVAAPTPQVPQGDTQPMLDVVPSSDTNAT